jgi:positive regulator of sigma E activity
MYSTEYTDTGHRVSGNTFLKQIVLEHKVSVGLKKKQVIKTSMLVNFIQLLRLD